MVFLVESTKSIKPTQLFIESPENLIPLEEKDFNLKTFHYSLSKNIHKGISTKYE